MFRAGQVLVPTRGYHITLTFAYRKFSPGPPYPDFPMSISTYLNLNSTIHCKYLAFLPRRYFLCRPAYSSHLFSFTPWMQSTIRAFQSLCCKRHSTSYFPMHLLVSPSPYNEFCTCPRRHQPPTPQTHNNQPHAILAPHQPRATPIHVYITSPQLSAPSHPPPIPISKAKEKSLITTQC